MSDREDTYQLLDAGRGRKLERFGDYVLDRPCAQAVWEPALPASEWQRADAQFSRDQGSHWTFRRRLAMNWTCRLDGIVFQLQPTDFGHVGVFPEHRRSWAVLRALKPLSPTPPKLLNLFAYSGGATLAAAQAGWQVCHLDASRKMVEWARRNAALNHLEQAPVRWLIDDVGKFLAREIRRGSQYDAVILDPPSFGRGTNQELFKIDDNMRQLLLQCRQVMKPDASGLLLSCHTPGYTPIVLTNLLTQIFGDGELHAGEMTIPAASGLDLPSGAYAFWLRARPSQG